MRPEPSDWARLLARDKLPGLDADLSQSDYRDLANLFDRIKAETVEGVVRAIRELSLSERLIAAVETDLKP